MTSVLNIAMTLLNQIGANKQEFLLSLILLFIAKAGNGKLATALWLIGGFFLLDSLGLWHYFLSLLSQKTGVSLSLSSLKDAVGGMSK